MNKPFVIRARAIEPVKAVCQIVVSKTDKGYMLFVPEKILLDWERQGMIDFQGDQLKQPENTQTHKTAYKKDHVTNRSLRASVRKFVRECCVVGDGCFETIPSIHKAWKNFCDENSIQDGGPGFYRVLRCVVPSIKKTDIEDVGRRNISCYEGIELIQNNITEGEQHE